MYLRHQYSILLDLKKDNNYNLENYFEIKINLDNEKKMYNTIFFCSELTHYLLKDSHKKRVMFNIQKCF